MIAAIGLNTSIDRRYIVDNTQWGGVHRVKNCVCTPGGKGLNVARIIHTMGEKVIAAGFIGGHSGAYVQEMLDMEGVPNEFVKAGTETRSCINILDLSSGAHTEFLEPGAAILPDEYDAFILVYRSLLKRCKVVTLSGSLPGGLLPTTYGLLVKMARENGVKVLLDTSGEALKAALPYGPSLIKPNEEEIVQLINVNGLSLQSIARAASSLHAKGVERAVVSLGGRGAILACDEGVYYAQPPVIEPVNTVGCGDAMTASLAISFARGDTAQEALRQAVAISAASALSQQTGGLDINEYSGILPKVILTTLQTGK